MQILKKKVSSFRAIYVRCSSWLSLWHLCLEICRHIVMDVDMADRGREGDSDHSNRGGFYKVNHSDDSVKVGPKELLPATKFRPRQAVLTSLDVNRKRTACAVFSRSRLWSPSKRTQFLNALTKKSKNAIILTLPSSSRLKKRFARKILRKSAKSRSKRWLRPKPFKNVTDLWKRSVTRLNLHPRLCQVTALNLNMEEVLLDKDLELLKPPPTLSKAVPPLVARLRRSAQRFMRALAPQDTSRSSLESSSETLGVKSCQLSSVVKDAGL